MDVRTPLLPEAIIRVWEAHGLVCAMAWHPVAGAGANGYVDTRRPDLDDHDWDVDVHGGITYAEDGWIGFDTAHYGDIWAGGEDPRGPHPFPLYLGHDDVRRLWTFDRLVAETEHLAAQVANICA